MVGVGNVALDVARILIKPAAALNDTDMADEVLETLARTRVSDVHILGRRGPAYTSFTTKELREIGQLDGVDVIMNPADLELDESSRARVGRDKVAARNVVVLQEWATRTPTGAGRRVHLHFWTRPTMIIGEGRVSGVQVERTMIDADGLVVGTGEQREIAAQLVVRSVGYRGLPLPGVPFDESHRSGAPRRGPGDPGRRLLRRRVRHRLDQAGSDRGDRDQQVGRQRDGDVATGGRARRCGPGQRTRRRS